MSSSDRSLFSFGSAAVAMPLIVSTFALLACSGGSKAALPESPAPQAASAPTAATAASSPATAEAGDALILTGTLEPAQRSVLSAKVGGTITAMHAREGNVVRRGAPLAEIDPEDFALRVKAADAAREAARLQREAAEQDWKRMRSLYDQKAISQSQWEKVEAGYRGAVAGAAQADAGADMAHKAQRDAVLRAPFDAVVTQRLAAVGEFATAMPPKMMMVVEEVGMLVLTIQASERYHGRIAQGDPIEVTLTEGGQKFLARIDRVVPSIDPRTRSFGVYADIANTDFRLQPGSFARVKFLPRKEGIETKERP